MEWPTLSGVPDVATKLKTYEVDYSNQSDMFAYTFNNDAGGTYVTFSARNGTITFILTLDPLGTFQAQIWREDSDNGKKKSWERFRVALGDGCDQYAHCRESAISNRVRESAESDNAMQCTCLIGFEPLYPQDWFIRCVEKRKVPGVCGKGDGEGFVRLEGLKVPDARFSRVYGTMSFKECEKACLKSCNCTGYTSADVSKIRGGCISWFREFNRCKKLCRWARFLPKSGRGRAC
ncbi:hypothetical protein ACOSP7_012266 [Xanthoceras sorbifolium]